MEKDKNLLSMIKAKAASRKNSEKNKDNESTAKKFLKSSEKTTPLRKKRDDADSQKLLITSFQWLYAVILLLYGFVFLFTVVFRVSTFNINTPYGTKTAGVLVSYMRKSPQSGDKLTISNGYSAFLGKVIAVSGDKISVGSERDSFANCITYNNKNYFSSEELQTVLKDMKIPEGHFLVTEIETANGYFRVGEIISQKQIIGKAECLVYPFNVLGKPINKLSEVY